MLYKCENIVAQAKFFIAKMTTLEAQTYGIRKIPKQLLKVIKN